MQAGLVGCKLCRTPEGRNPLQQLPLKFDLVEGLGRKLKAAQARSEETFAFVQEWMELPAATRKALSHHRAIRAQAEWHPCAWVDPLLGDTFDPGNFVYGFTLRFLMPQLREASAWNDETLGDVAESVLAVGLGGHGQSLHLPSTDEQIKKMALLFEDTSRDMFGVFCFFPSHDTPQKMKELGYAAHQQVRKARSAGCPNAGTAARASAAKYVPT